ncbi:hypothetical protein IKF34_02505 [Candidatus Saccharibacteria bacterium]|nr:hypothetical protein [Candidatus Saccharibacteria bacterium]
MKNKKAILAVGAITCSTLLTPAFSAITYAEGASSYFDWAAQECIIENYNSEFNKTATEMEKVELAKITTLNCANKGISNFRGVTLLTALESLDISGNTKLNLEGLDFSQNTKLKSINVSGMPNQRYLNLVSNSALETIITDRNLTIASPAYLAKLSDAKEYAYGMDLSKLKLFTSSTAKPVTDDAKYPAKFDEKAKSISYKSEIPPAAVLDFGDYTIGLETRPNTIFKITLKLMDKDDTDKYKEIDLDQNFVGNLYYGDTIDTDQIFAKIKELYKEKYDFSKYTLAKVDINMPNKDKALKFSTDKAESKKAIINAAGERISLVYQLDLPSVKTPDTGAFTSDSKTLIAAASFTAITTISILAFVGSYAAKRSKAKVKFNK